MLATMPVPRAMTGRMARLIYSQEKITAGL